MGKKISYSDVEVGKQYMYEESLYSEGLDVIIFRAIVSILQDMSNDEYWRYVLRIDKWIDGMCQELSEGYKFESGITKDKTLYNLASNTGYNSFYGLVKN